MTELFINMFINIRLLDIIDIILVGLLFYILYYLVRGSSAINIFFGIVTVIIALKIVTLFHMELLSYILGAFVNVGFIALIIIFQPEIRRFLLSIGNSRFAVNFRQFFSFLGVKYQNEDDINIDPICEACTSMSQSKVGALILITQENELTEIIETGVVIDAVTSKSLIENIFFKNSPLHDGAMIIKNDRIVAARCVLPNTSNPNIPSHFGMRHRAGIGVSENNDCIVLVVSEETGSIRIIQDGVAKDIKPAEMKAEIKRRMKVQKPAHSEQ